VHRHGDDDGDDDVVNLDAIEANLASWRLENVEPDSNRRYFAIASYWIVGAIATVWGLLLVGQVVGVNDWLKQRQRSSSSTARPTWDNEECQALKESSDPDAGDPQRQRQTRGSFNYGSIGE
jgi:hypothetical protein